MNMMEAVCKPVLSAVIEILCNGAQVYQERATKALQARLTEIATPTAAHRMELRRQSSADDLLDPGRPTSPAPGSDKDHGVGRNKVWVGGMLGCLDA